MKNQRPRGWIQFSPNTEMNDLIKYHSLGVINRTPNSFSDSGLSLNSSFFDQQIKAFLDDPKVIIDIGFESTAPMNQSITSTLEWERFELFLEAIKKFDLNKRIVSFDTYKIANFLRMHQALSALYQEAQFIFNDVSGVLDNELRNALISFKGPKFYYIYTFSHIPERGHVCDHMNYLDETSDVLFQCQKAFLRAVTFFKELGMESQLLLDPGFGFSKTFDQNWKLINSFGELSKGLVSLGIKNPMVIGLSKKSFLKKAINSSDVDLLEKIHGECLKKMKLATHHQLLFRVHDTRVLKGL